MSTLNVNSIVDEPGTGAPDFPNGASVNGNPLPTAGSLSNRNKIINGAMAIDQRNAGASVTPTNTQYLVDRWWTWLSQASKLTAQQNAGAVTPPAGFNTYQGITSSSAYSVLTSDYFALVQHVEAFNFADLSWGTADAKPITLSFWVRSSLTGTFGGAFANAAQNRSYPFAYTINSANTWEHITITVAGDTSGTWEGATNGIGVRVQFGLGVGSSNSNTAGAWYGTNYISATGATSVVGTNGATFYITGVQLEAGDVATPFEHRSYGQELALCQRYFEKSFNQATAPAQNVGVNTGEFQSPASKSGSVGNWFPSIVFAVTKRAAPSVVLFNPSAANGQIRDFVASGDFSSSAFNTVGTSGLSLYGVANAGTSVGNVVGVHWTASSEI